MDTSDLVTVTLVNEHAGCWEHLSHTLTLSLPRDPVKAGKQLVLLSPGEGGDWES